MFFGSYFGDWDNESNFLRSALGSGNVLTASCSGFPHWFYHHMAMGFPIGYSTVISQNNKPGGLYLPHTPGAGQVHMALMGDPTLRMHVVAPPNSFGATSTASGLRLNWEIPMENNIAGYLLYRANENFTSFEKISGENLLTEPSFVDPVGEGTHRYMVKAVKLEESGGGTYFNSSHGRFLTATHVSVPPPFEPVSLQGRISGNKMILTIAGEPLQKFEIQARNETGWQNLRTDVLGTGPYVYEEVITSSLRFFRVESKR
jgi:hypothetical protein